MDEIERELGMTWCPSPGRWAWARSSAACWTCASSRCACSARRGPRDTQDEIIDGLDNPLLASASACLRAGRGEVELVREAAPAFDEAEFLAGRQTPMFFGSAINNFGVREVLDALVDLAPPPGPSRGHPARGAARGAEVQRRGVQDPGQHGPGAPRPHRLRARGQRPLRARHAAEGGAQRQGAAAQHRGQLPEPARELLDEAFAGDIIGIPNHGVLQLGDTSPKARRCSSPACPSSRPRCSAASRWPTR
jgi:peptide chain release factor 3